MGRIATSLALIGAFILTPYAAPVATAAVPVAPASLQATATMLGD